MKNLLRFKKHLGLMAALAFSMFMLIWVATHPGPSGPSRTEMQVSEIKTYADERLREGGYERVGYLGFQVPPSPELSPAVYYSVRFRGDSSHIIYRVCLKKEHNEIMIYADGRLN